MAGVLRSAALVLTVTLGVGSGIAEANDIEREQDWLLGNPIGYRLPPGTTYATNLRLTVQPFTEDQWVQYAKTAKPRPPMPWWSLHDTTEPDLRAMYRYIKHLGPAGQPSPPFVPPDKEPPPPYETRHVVR